MECESTLLVTTSSVELQRMKVMAGFVSSARFFSVNKLVCLLLFVLSSGYRGGRRGEIEGWLGLWQQLLMFLLFPEELYCGSAGWKRPATRRPAWFGALLPPMRFLAFLQDPGVRAGWKLRRHQRGSFLQSSQIGRAHV